MFFIKSCPVNVLKVYVLHISRAWIKARLTITEKNNYWEVGIYHFEIKDVDIVVPFAYLFIVIIVQQIWMSWERGGTGSHKKVEQ